VKKNWEEVPTATCSRLEDLAQGEKRKMQQANRGKRNQTRTIPQVLLLLHGVALYSDHRGGSRDG